MQRIAQSPLRSCLLLVLISVGTLFFRLGALPFIGADEPRYARISYEMFLQHRWVTPILDGQPWLEKPPLYYWLTIPVVATLGSNETSARLTPALCALATALVILWLGGRVFTPLSGLYGAIILLTSLGFVAFGRSASTDMPMTASLTLALALLCRAAADPSIGGWPVWGSYAALGLGVLAKGPIALILAAGIGAVFWWLDARGGIFKTWRPGSGLLVTAAVSFPWFWLAYRQNGSSFIAIFFLHHNLARYVSDLHHHSEPAYYYLPVLFGLLFPWSGWLPLLAPRAILQELRDWQNWNRAILFLACWAAFPLFFFSLSQSKLAGYILPCLPPLALILGRRMALLHSENVTKPQPAAAPWTYLLFSAATGVTLILVFQVNYGGRWQVGLLLAAVVLFPGLLAFQFVRRGRIGTAVQVTLLQGLLLVVAAAQFAFPVLAEHHSTRDIALHAMALRGPSEPIVTYSFFHHTLHYYTGYQIAADLPDEKALNRFALAHPRFLVVTELGRVEEIFRLQAFHIEPLAQQGKLRLLRVIHQ